MLALSLTSQSQHFTRANCATFLLAGRNLMAADPFVAIRVAFVKYTRTMRRRQKKLDKKLGNNARRRFSTFCPNLPFHSANHTLCQSSAAIRVQSKNISSWVLRPILGMSFDDRVAFYFHLFFNLMTF